MIFPPSSSLQMKLQAYNIYMEYHDGYLTIEKKIKGKFLAKNTPFKISYPDPKDNGLIQLNFETKEMGKSKVTLHQTDQKVKINKLTVIFPLYTVFIEWK